MSGGRRGAVRRRGFVVTAAAVLATAPAVPGAAAQAVSDQPGARAPDAYTSSTETPYPVPGVTHTYRMPAGPRAAPMPDPTIRDPDVVREEKAKHDQVTGADLSQFGDAYQDASPLDNFDTNTKDAAPPLRGGPPP